MAKKPILPQGVYNRILPKVILYKVDRDTRVFKFNHELTITPGLSKTYSAIGPDPADLDLHSTTMHAALTGKTLGRMPYDCWIPRVIGAKIDNISGAVALDTDLSDSEKSYYQLEDIDAEKIRLNWKNLSGREDYRRDFKDFVSARKQYLLSALRTTQLPALIQEYDLSDFVTSYRHVTQLGDFNNSVDMRLSVDPRSMYSGGNVIGPVSSANFSDAFLSSSIVGNLATMGVDAASELYNVPLIEENDVVEIRVKYILPDAHDITNTDDTKFPAKESGFVDEEGFQRVFIGFVSSITRDFGYGQQETLTLRCDGVSKMFSMYDASFVPSLAAAAGVTLEEGIDSGDLRVVAFQNACNGMSAAKIFSYFLEYGMFSLSAEDLEVRRQAAQQEIRRIEQQKTELLASAPKDVNTAKELSDLTDLTIKYTQEIQALTDASMRLPSSELKQKLKNSVKNLDAEVKPPDALDFKAYFTNTRFFTDSATSFQASFQTIHYIPLLLGAAKEYAIGKKRMELEEHYAFTPNKVDQSRGNDVLSTIVATAEQGSNIAYQTMLAHAFRMYMPEMKSPASIFNDVRSATHAEIFEDRPGVIRLRPPKYNIINVNKDIGDFPDTLGQQPEFILPNPKGEGSEDIVLNGSFIISPFDIESVTITRDDASIRTRSDHSVMMPLAGEPVPGFTGWYCDPAYLMKYGLRLSGQSQNPMAISPMLASYMSALELARQNKDARTISLTVFNNREYQVGRLYYIPVTTGEGSNEASVVSRGLVGYVTSITTNYSYNEKPSHTLTLEYIRQAEILALTTLSRPYITVDTSVQEFPMPGNTILDGELIGANVVETTREERKERAHYYVNFKKLPDISTLIRKLSSDPRVRGDLDAATTGKASAAAHEPAVDSGALCHGRLTLENGVTVSDLKDKLRSLGYADTLVSTGCIPGLNLTQDIRNDIEPEKAVFCTPFVASAIADTTTQISNLKKFFIGKLCICEMDPLLKLYPTLQPSATRYVNKVLPTDSMYIRHTKDLMQFIAKTALDFAETVQGDTTVRKLDSLPNYPIYVSDKSETLVIPPSIKYSRGNNNQIHIVVTRNKNQAQAQALDNHVISCVIYATRNGVTVISKLLLFFVPPDKSARLANLINTGTFEAGGFRKIVPKGGKDTQAVDAHSSGQGILFSDVEASLWSVSDIINNCVEFDLYHKPHEGQMPKSVADEWDKLLSLSYNAMLEPRYMDPVYGIPAGVTTGPIYSGMHRSDFTYDNVGKNILDGLMQGIWPAVMRAGLPIPSPTKFTERYVSYASQTNNYKEFVTGLKSTKYVTVPFVTEYIKRYFENIAAARQKFPRYATVIRAYGDETSREDGFAADPIPWFLTLVSRGFAPAYDAKRSPLPDSYTLPDTLLVDNRSEFRNELKTFKDLITPSTNPESLTSGFKAISRIQVSAPGISKLNEQILTNRAPGSEHGYAIDLRAYILGTNAQVAPHVIMLIDSLFLKYPPAAKTSLPAPYLSKNDQLRSFCIKHPLSYLWHGSYIDPAVDDPYWSFESGQEYIDTKDAYRRMNLLPLLIRGGE